jgi:hypothetical protein
LSYILFILYYIFNYLIKDDIKIYNLVLIVALFKIAMKRAKAAISPLIPA